MIKLNKRPILQNCQLPNGFFGITVNFSLQILKNKLVSRAKIYLSMGKMWAIMQKKYEGTHLLPLLALAPGPHICLSNYITKRKKEEKKNGRFHYHSKTDFFSIVFEHVRW